MSYLALYRKYRPDNFNDLVGQNEVSNIIRNEIINNRLSHAYLFSGPRGTGKTSTAKIIAKMINCNNLSEDGIPCGKCESCINFNNSNDIVEIDAASNNGVDEIRDLRDKVNLVPTYGKYKIYIIDEVHMLTTQAFNALLKTLEEPPSHIVFILATTEFHKIPVTVISRCQKFQFYKFSNSDIIDRLSFIASKEGINVDKNVLFEIARLSDGGMRDAINMLDQLSSFGDNTIAIDDVYLLNGVLSFEDFFKLLNYIHDNKTVDIIDFIENIDKTGKSFDRFIYDFISFLKDILILKKDVNYSFDNEVEYDYISKSSKIFDESFIYNFIISLNDISISLKTSSFGKILLITYFIKLSNLHFGNNSINDFTNNFDENKSLINNNDTFDEADNVLINNNVDNKFVFNDKIKLLRINNTFATASKDLKDDFISKWDTVLEKLSNDDFYSSISLMVRDLVVQVVGKNNIIFIVPYDSLLDRLINNVKLIEKLLYDVYNNDYRCVFLLDDEWKYEKNKYINNLKNGKSYEYIEEVNDDDDNVFDNSDDLNKIVSILGNDVISYE